jgi:hypothetical protein
MGIYGLATFRRTVVSSPSELGQFVDDEESTVPISAVTTRQATQRHIPEDLDHQLHRCVDLHSRIVFMLSVPFCCAKCFIFSPNCVYSAVYLCSSHTAACLISSNCAVRYNSARVVSVHNFKRLAN